MEAKRVASTYQTISKQRRFEEKRWRWRRLAHREEVVGEDGLTNELQASLVVRDGHCLSARQVGDDGAIGVVAEELVRLSVL